MTARIAEISTKFKAPMEDVRSALMGSASAFKMFADSGASAAKQSESIAAVMNRYTDALKNTGLSAQSSVNLVSQMTNSIAGLNMAQKAFLSQQSGGPGGLRGAFQMEGLLARDPGKAFELVRKQMQSQFGGNIVSQQQAEGSEQAAQQRQRQMLMLQQGPLAQFAKTDQEAGKILDAFRNIQEGKSTSQELSKNVALDQVNKGKQIENTSKTPLSDLRSVLEGTRYTVNVANLGTMQRATTAAAGIKTTADTTAQKQMRNRVSAQTNSVDVNSDVGTIAAKNIDDAKSTASSIPNSILSFGQGLFQSVFSDNKSPDLAKQKSDLKQDMNKGETLNNKPSLTNFTPSQYSNLSEDNFGNKPDQIMNDAINTSTNNSPTVQPQVNATANQSGNTSVKVDLDVNAICTVCKHNIEVSKHARSVNPSVE